MKRCEFTELEEVACSHCCESELDVSDAPWERHDYVAINHVGDEERQVYNTPSVEELTPPFVDMEELNSTISGGLTLSKGENNGS